LYKRIKLKEVLSLSDLYNQYIQEFANRKEKDNIEFKFDFDELSEVERLGYSCYLNKMENRLFNDWKGMIKYIKLAEHTIDKNIIFKYEFYTEKEYKKHKLVNNLKFILEFILVISIVPLIIFLMNI
jgi:hypothetical protein